ncbi:MAG: putative permease, DMT superfamily [Parcubacteria group bacterium Greene0416_79]|nr:MAG: putative permease, DMT superfamily [Parcubacteria group bacterium Greene0416_79]
MKTQQRMATWGPVLVFLAAMLWATDAPFRYHLTRELGASFIVLAEHAVNVLLILPFIFRGFSEIKNLNRRQWLAVLLIGIGASAIATILFTKSFSYMNPSVAIVLQKLQPLIAITLAVLFLKERTGKRFFAWAIIALAGAYVISFPTLKPELYAGEAWNPHLIGVLLALGAAALWGLGTVLGRYLLRNQEDQNIANTYDRKYLPSSEATTPVHIGAAPNGAALQFHTLTALRFLIAFLFLLVLNLNGNILPTLSTLTGKDILFLIIIAVTSGFTSLMIYYQGLRHTKASVATIAELGFPLLAVVVNAAAIGVFLEGMQLLGMGLLLFAVFGLSRQNRLSSPVLSETI